MLRQRSKIMYVPAGERRLAGKITNPCADAEAQGLQASLAPPSAAPVAGIFVSHAPQCLTSAPIRRLPPFTPRRVTTRRPRASTTRRPRTPTTRPTTGPRTTTGAAHATSGTTSTAGEDSQRSHMKAAEHAWCLGPRNLKQGASISAHHFIFVVSSSSSSSSSRYMARLRLNHRLRNSSTFFLFPPSSLPLSLPPSLDVVSHLTRPPSPPRRNR